MVRATWGSVWSSTQLISLDHLLSGSRWDGRGYPDGLKGDDIPISAQLVALADVYDALTSERCYKKAFSHEKAVQMIQNGECGAFNPLLLQCLTDTQDELNEKLHPQMQEKQEKE